MKLDQITEIINKALVEEFEIDPEQLTPQARLVEDLGLDSLDFVDMVVILQNSTSINIREEPRIREVRTVGDLYCLLAELASAQDVVG